MFVIGYFLSSLAMVLNVGLTFYMWVIIARVVLSWISPDPFNPIVRFVRYVTEPVLYPVRRRLPVAFSGTDFSPVIMLLAIIFLRAFLVNSLVRLSGTLL